MMNCAATACCNGLERGISLGFADLEVCAFNLFGEPSWFDRFGGNEAA
jgi:hypothetical protein